MPCAGAFGSSGIEGLEEGCLVCGKWGEERLDADRDFGVEMNEIDVLHLNIKLITL
jgi:hypothetical protein